MYNFQYDYIKPKYAEKAKLFYMETDLVCRHSFIVYMRTEDTYANIAKGVETSLIFRIMNQAEHYLKEKIKKLQD